MCLIKIMRTLVIICWVMGLLTLNSCNQKPDTNSILANSKTRIEIYNAIVNDHNFMPEFMKNMQSSDHAMQMMMKDSMMMSNMMGNNDENDARKWNDE